MSLGTCITKYPVYVNDKMYAAVIDLESYQVSFYDNKNFLGQPVYLYTPKYFCPSISYVNLISDGIRSFERNIEVNKQIEQREKRLREELDQWNGRIE